MLSCCRDVLIVDWMYLGELLMLCIVGFCGLLVMLNFVVRNILLWWFVIVWLISFLLVLKLYMLVVLRNVMLRLSVWCRVVIDLLSLVVLYAKFIFI